MTRHPALLLGLLLAGCASGPDYHPPLIAPAKTAPFLGTGASSATLLAEPTSQWWKLYDDPVLDGLVGDALVANTDLRVALARLERARADLQGARSARTPTTSLSASADYRRLPDVNALPGQDKEGALIDGGLDMAYEVDLFGRVRRGIEAARGDVGAAAADTDAVRVVIVSDTISAYVDAAAAAEQLDVAHANVALLDRSVQVTQKRFDAGLAEKLDVLRITALRDEQKTRIPDIEARRAAALFRLATLTGRSPGELPPSASERATIPVIRQPIPVGDGAGLLARRPDVRAAERRLAAATARVGVATADLYPHISLGGSIGSTSTSLGDFFGGGALRFLVGPLISWSFPNTSAARARVAAADADSKAALATFDGTVLRALEETETALTAYAKALKNRSLLTTRLESASRASRIVRSRQREGTVDSLAVIDAERSASDARTAVAENDARVADAQISLFRALAGGWTIVQKQEQ